MDRSASSRPGLARSIAPPLQLPSLALEDCATRDAPKFDEYGTICSSWCTTFSQARRTRDTRSQIHAFLAESYLITVHDNPVPSRRGWRKAASDPTVLRRGPAGLLHDGDAMIDSTFPSWIAQDKVERWRRRCCAARGGQGAPSAGEIFSIRSTLVSLRRVMRPVRDVVAS